MISRRARMIEDKYLRDSARALVDADLENIKTAYAQKGLGERAMDRLTEGAVDLYEEAVAVADDNKGALAALVAAVLVWFSRNPILEALGFSTGRSDDEWDQRDEVAEH